MPTQADLISKSDELVEIFGSWPSFHDSEVVALRMERHGVDEFDGPELFVTFHLFEARPDEGRESGASWHKHTLATLRFSRVSELNRDRCEPRGC